MEKKFTDQEYFDEIEATIDLYGCSVSGAIKKLIEAGILVGHFEALRSRYNRLKRKGFKVSNDAYINNSHKDMLDKCEEGLYPTEEDLEPQNEIEVAESNSYTPDELDVDEVSKSLEKKSDDTCASQKNKLTLWQRLKLLFA